MARTSTATKAATPVEKPADKPQDTSAATFDWDALADPSAVEYTSASHTSAVDWEKITPDPIKARVKESYETYEDTAKELTEKARKASGTYELTEAQVKRVQDLAGKAATRRQECGTVEMAKEFARLARGYAGHLGYTLRGDVAKEQDTSKPKGEDGKHPVKLLPYVVYRVKPKETRTRS